MTMAAFTATADVTGVATVFVTPDKAGVQWTIGQLGIETRPNNANVSAIVTFNGRYVTSSSVLPSSASGQPAINLQSVDKVTVQFSGMNVGEQAIVTVFYNESLWGTMPTMDVV